MTFEFDPAKSAANKTKHGVDFVEAQAIWNAEIYEEPSVIEVSEPRFSVTGKINGKFYTAIITYRGAAVRIISVRRCRPEEKENYENS